jgi:hypothetical protein
MLQRASNLSRPKLWIKTVPRKFSDRKGVKGCRLNKINSLAHERFYPCVLRCFAYSNRLSINLFQIQINCFEVNDAADILQHSQKQNLILCLQALIINHVQNSLKLKFIY